MSLRQTAKMKKEEFRKEITKLNRSVYALVGVAIVVLLIILMTFNNILYKEVIQLNKDNIELVEAMIDMQEEILRMKEEVADIKKNVSDFDATATTTSAVTSTQEIDEYVYNISEADKEIIAKLVYAEARGECFEGKVSIAAVVLNRYFYGNDEDFKRESIESVILQKNQFASISDVTTQNLEEDSECMEAVEAACRGVDPTRSKFPKGALYFYNPNLVSGYQEKIRQDIEILVIGDHNFHYDFEKVT